MASPQNEVSMQIASKRVDYFDTHSTSLMSSQWQGDALLLEGKREEAITLWQKNRVDSQLLVSRGQHALASDDFETAVYWYTLALQLLDTPDPYETNQSSSVLHYEIGNIYQNHLEPSNTNLAQQSYEKAIEINDFNSHHEKTISHLSLGEIYQKQENFTDAITQFQEALLLEPDNYWANGRLGLLLFITANEQNAQQIEHAELLLQKAIQLEPKTPAAYTWLINLYKNQNNFEQAEKFTEQLIQIDPETESLFASTLFLELGNAYKNRLTLQNIDKAQTAYQKALELNSFQSQEDVTSTYIALGDLYQFKNDAITAIHYYREALNTNASHYLATSKLGHALFLTLNSTSSEEQKQEAENLLLTAIQIEPSEPLAYEWLIAYYKQQNKYEQAINIYHQLLANIQSENLPYESSLLLELGDIYYKNLASPKLQEAQQAYQSAINLDNFRNQRDQVYAHTTLGELFQSQNMYPEAISAYEKALELDPNYYWALSRLGLTLYISTETPTLETIQRAENLLLQAIEVNSSTPAAYRWLAFIYRQQNNIEDATKYYTLLLEVSPNDEGAIRFLERQN